MIRAVKSALIVFMARLQRRRNPRTFYTKKIHTPSQLRFFAVHAYSPFVFFPKSEQKQQFSKKKGQLQSKVFGHSS